ADHRPAEQRPVVRAGDRWAPGYCPVRRIATPFTTRAGGPDPGRAAPRDEVLRDRPRAGGIPGRHPSGARPLGMISRRNGVPTDLVVQFITNIAEGVDNTISRCYDS